MTTERGKRELAYHIGKDGKRYAARVLCVAISYYFENYPQEIREGNQEDLENLEHFCSTYSNCYFIKCSPSALEMREQNILSEEGIKKEFKKNFGTELEPPTLFILFILSHGSAGGTIWTDTKIGEHYDCFSTADVLLALKKNKFLYYAVKMILFGPCRGDDLELSSLPMQGFHQQTEINEYSTRVEYLPEQDNFAIFYSTVESNRAKRQLDGTVMVNSFVLTLNNSKTDFHIIELFTRITKHASAKQMPQYTVFPHLATYFCKWTEETSDAIGCIRDHFKLGNSPFRRALIFSDGTSKEITTKFHTSLNTLGFQVHCNQLNLLMQTVRNISRLEMRSDEAWLLIFVFVTIKKTGQDRFYELGIAANAADGITPMREIVQLFTGANCSSYAEKPKTFFFLDANNESFDSLPIHVHTQQDIKASINNHSGIFLCSSADKDFIDKLPSELNRMIDEKMSLQQVVFNLMETEKSRYLTRLWSTSPEKICILEHKICPVHPELLCEGATMTIANIAKQVKTRSNCITIVEASSAEERHAASVELYSHSVIENPVPDEMVMYLNTSDALIPTEVQLQRVRTIERTCKKSAESNKNFLVVVEYCGIELNTFLEDFLNFLIRWNGKALIVSTVESEDCVSVATLANLKIKVSDLLQKYDEEILQKEQEKEMDIQDKKNPTTFEGCNYESITLTLRTDVITAVENLPTGACVQELCSSNDNLLFAKLLSNSIPGLCYFILSDFLSVESGIRQKWVNRNPDITIVFIVNEDEYIRDNINLGVCKWFVLKACAKNTSSKITDNLKISILDDLSLKALDEHIINFYGANTALAAVVSENIKIEEKITDLVNLKFFCNETKETLLTTKFFIDRKIDDQKNKTSCTVSELTSKIFEDDQTNIFLISAESGMGKTKFTMELQKHLNEKVPDHWIHNIGLNNRCTELADIKSGKINMTSIQDFETFVLNPLIFNSPLYLKILENKLKLRKVVFLLDAFDEIASDYSELVFNIISLVLDMKLKVVISTRPREEHNILHAFKSKSILVFKLGILEPVQQVDFIAQCWLQNDETLTDIDECQFKALSFLPKIKDAFETIHTPLLLKMFADTVSPRQETFDVLKDVYEWHIEKFYHKIIETDCDISPDKPRSKGAFQRELKNLRLVHLKAAICALLHKEKCDEWTEEDISTINESGLAVVTDNGIRFYHISFAHYLLSCALVNFMLNRDNLLKDTQLLQVLTDVELKEVRQFLELKFSAVVDNRLKDIEISRKNSDLLFKNIISENLPNFYKIFQTTVLGVDVNQKIECNGIFYRPLTLAICLSDKVIVQGILKTGGNLDSFIKELVEPSKFNNFFHKACKKGHLAYVKEKIIHLKEDINNNDDDGRTPLSYAIEFNNIEIIMTLLEHGAKFMSSKKFIQEALKEAQTFKEYTKFSKCTKGGWKLDCSMNHFCHSLMKTGPQSFQIGYYCKEINICEDVTSFEEDIEVQIACRNVCNEKNNLEHTHLLKLLSKYLLECKQIEADQPTFIHAAEIGHVSVIQYMIRTGQDVNEKSCFFRSALHVAVTLKKFSAVKAIIDSGKASINIEDSGGNTPLHYAVLAKSENIVQLLLEKGAEVNCKNDLKNSPLHFAALEGHCAILTTLLRFGATVDGKNLTNVTSLGYSTASGVVEATKTLLAHGADPHVVYENGGNCLHAATVYGHREVVEILLQHVPVDFRDKKMRTPLSIACSGDNRELVLLFLNKGADPKVVDMDGNTCLHFAALKNNMEFVQLFSEYIPVNSMNSILYTPLTFACHAGNLDILHYLVQIGTDIQILDGNGCSCLHIAAALGHLAVVQALIPKISMELKNKYGKTALLLAAAEGQLDAIVCLIKHGADFSSKINEEAANGLHVAALCGQLEVVKVFTLLLPIDEVDLKGRTALVHAVQHGHKKVVKYLLENGANGKVMHPLYGTCLHIAAGHGYFDIVKIFLSHVSINCQDNLGRTPLMCAVTGGSLQVIKWLLANGADPLIPSQEVESTCLHAICCMNENYMEILELFAPLKGVNVTGLHGRTPLILATIGGKLDAMKFLLHAGADITATSSELKRSCIHFAVLDSHLECVKFLVETCPALIEARDHVGGTPIAYACEKGSVAIVQYLLDKGANTSVLARDGSTLLHIASHSLELMQLIVDLIPVNSRNKKGESPLWHAYICKNMGCIKLLLEKGADVNPPDLKEGTYLHLAAHFNNLDLAEIFLPYLSINVLLESDHSTPLLVAAANNSVQAIQFFIENGADTTLLNDLGFNCLTIAAFNGHLECVKVLISFMPIDIAHRDGSTPFMQAAQYGHLEILQFLLIKGANVAALDKDGNTCLHYAVLSRKLALVQFLANFVPLNHINEVGLTCRDIASLMNKQDIADYLCSKGARRNIQCNSWRDLIENGQNEVIAYFLDRLNAKVDIRDTELVRAIFKTLQDWEVK